MAEPRIFILKARLHFQEYEIEGVLPTSTGPSAAQILRAGCLVLAGTMIKANFRKRRIGIFAGAEWTDHLSSSAGAETNDTAR